MLYILIANRSSFGKGGERSRKWLEVASICSFSTFEGSTSVFCHDLDDGAVIRDNG